MVHYCKIKWKMLWLLLTVCTFHVQCIDIYFPTGSIELRIPVFNLKISQQPLAILPAKPINNSILSVSSISYNFSGSELLRASNEGYLFFTDSFHNHPDQNKQLNKIYGWLVARDKSGHFNRTSLRVNLMSGEEDCELLTRDLCFWTSVKYSILENQPATDVGLLASPYLADMCSGYNISYELLNATDYLTIGGASITNNWSLRTIRPLERDIERSGRKLRTQAGSMLRASVRCVVAAPSGTTRDMQRVLQLQLLDQNDNPPRAQFSEKVLNVTVKDEASLEAELTNINHLFFIDRDSIDVNNYTVKLLGDDLHLFMVNFTVWVDDRGGEHQTAIHFRLWPVPNARIPDSGYSIILQVNDTAMLPGFGSSTANLTIRFFTKTANELSPVVANLRRNLLYSATANVFKTAAPLARVTQPLTNVNITMLRFRLTQDPTNGAFNVTYRGGIVYVKNISELRLSSSPVALEIQWFNKTSNETSSDLISVYLEVESNPSCTDIKSMKTWFHCASIVSAKQCERTCGLSTGGKASVAQYQRDGRNRCMWRGERIPGNTMTTLYSTCTPDLDTCPDRVCDELEKLHPWICPQDCAIKVFSGKLNEITLKGIYKGVGICKCDTVDGCYCNVKNSPSSRTPIITTAVSTAVASSEFPTSLSPTVLSSPSQATNVSYHIDAGMSGHPTDVQTATASSICGPTCVLTAAGGALFFLAMLSVVGACWRRRRAADVERRDRKLATQSNYTDTDRSPTVPGPNTLLLNFEMNEAATLGYAAPKIIPVVDSKWEFPREKLRIEQTLGEGEFGRVLRAKALEISNLPGYSTVAVKTLKEGARDAELTDLMSEYQLLKEVSHPNVIRLLGACTLPDGPVYLIIEFAEHGSLRNYLRRSRHLESEGQKPYSTALMLDESEPAVLPICKITPRDILSFAWQISKGMAYLNDMKLVHRDLAARNVLLASDMVCKISDFGLTRDVYEDDTYLKRTKGRVPVKWMAPESLADHIYNSKSDVWSFGILLWELVTLGASPYPGVSVQNLFHLLRSGYRMEKPENCSTVFYKIMRTCWANDSKERPPFRSLVLKFESMLSDGVDYLDLNPRVVHNRTYFTSFPTPDEPIIMQQDAVNFHSQPPNDTKCAEIDKLQVLWQRPESPRSYENDAKTQELHHYESPIKCRNKTAGLRTPTNDRPQSYIDMAGAASEVQNLLQTKNKSDESVSKVTSL